MTRVTALCLVAAGILSACTPPVSPSGPVQGLVPDANGLQPNGTPLRIDFGRAEAGVIPAVSRLLGRDPVSRGPVAGCSLSAVRWDTGLTLWFDSEAFVGWTAADSIGTGSAGHTCTGV